VQGLTFYASAPLGYGVLDIQTMTYMRLLATAIASNGAGKLDMSVS
jgi:hypothetical protein